MAVGCKLRECSCEGVDGVGVKVNVSSMNPNK